MSRRLPCPQCGGSCYPSYPQVDDATLAGSSRDLIQDANIWKCESCKADVKASDLPLEAEEERNMCEASVCGSSSVWITRCFVFTCST